MQKLKDDARAWREAQIVRDYIEAVRKANETAELNRVGVWAGGGDGSVMIVLFAPYSMQPTCDQSR